jgi:hypothetical protein
LLGGDFTNRNHESNRPGWIPDEQAVENLKINKRLKPELADKYLNTIRALKEANGQGSMILRKPTELTAMPRGGN